MHFGSAFYYMISFGGFVGARQFRMSFISKSEFSLSPVDGGDFAALLHVCRSVFFVQSGGGDGRPDWRHPFAVSILSGSRGWH